MSEPLANVLPIYFVADHSGSMGPHIDALNNALQELLDTMRFESFAASKVRFAVVGFNSAAGVVMPISDLRFVEAVPQFEAYGTTDYSSVLNLLAAQLPADVAELKAQGHRVFRPAVFFMTDGCPTDTEQQWRAALDHLNSLPARPTLLSFGIGDADDGVLAAIASPNLAHRYSGTGSPADALSAVITSLTNSVVQSGNALGDPTAAQALHFEPPADFVRIDIEEV